MTRPETYLFYDFETTGIPFWGEPSELPKQPHIVEIGALLVDQTGEEIGRVERLVQPDGWEIPPDTIAVHGITNQEAMDLGIPEEEALDEFLALAEEATMRVGFGESFDYRIARIAMKRFGKGDPAAWKALPNYCCMWKTKKRLGLGKTPKLEEAYHNFFGEMPKQQHRAMADALSTQSIFWQLKMLELAET